jgi:hypothetical protein
MVLLKPGRHGHFIRNVRWNDILYRGFMFCSVFYISERLKTTIVDGEEGKKDEQADYMRRRGKKG